MALDAADTILEPGYLVIEGERIVDMGGGRPDADGRFDADIDLGNRLVMPGLVNAHTHSPMVLFRGMVEGNSLFTFDGWYNTIRVVEEKMTPDMIGAAVSVSCAEMIRTGTTTFVDQYFWMDEIVPRVQRSGMRAALAYGVVELGSPEARERELAAAAAFLESLKGHERLYGWLGPHAFFVDNSEEAMALELAMAQHFDTGLHIHFGTSGEEERYCRDRYGRSATAQLQAMGLLQQPIIAAHCLTVPLADLQALAAAPFTAVIAPSSFMRNAASIPPLAAMRAAGLNTAIGTDNVTNNNSYDLFKEMQILGKLMALEERQPNAIPTRYLLEMATMGGARALGLEDEIGSLEPGKRADLIALDLNEIGWAPRDGQDVYTALVYGVSGMHVRDVMADGRWLYRDGSWQTIDYLQERLNLERDLARLKTRLQEKVRGEDGEKTGH